MDIATFHVECLLCVAVLFTNFDWEWIVAMEIDKVCLTSYLLTIILSENSLHGAILQFF